MVPNVSIIIINWNGWKDTIICLESIYQTNYPNFNVILVDNASTDNSIDKIIEFSKNISKKKYGFFDYNFKDVFENKCNIELTSYKNLILIKNDKNYGFAEGNNIGIKFAFDNLNPQYILLLNNDTLVDINFLKELVNVAESDKEIGSVQSLLLRPGGNIIDSLGQEISVCTAKDKGINLKYKYNVHNTKIFGACAATALYRRKTLENTGLFDKDFFIILEDVNFSWKIRLNGFKSVLASKSIVYHNRGISEVMTVNDIIFSKKTPDIIFKWYHSSKNWLIILIRYYSLFMIGKAIMKCPHKLFFTIFKCIYSSLKIGKFRKYLN